MSKKFPIDEFDSVTATGGRHRAVRTAKDRVLEWLAVFAAAVLIGGLGYLGLKFVESSSVFDGYLPSGNPSPAASAQALPEVAVLDGGGKEMATVAGQILKDAGFNVAQASVLVDAENKPVAIDKTLVVITDEIFRADAEQVAAKIGGSEVLVSPQFPGPIAVVLGADYLPPAE